MSSTVAEVERLRADLEQRKEECLRLLEAAAVEYKRAEEAEAECVRLRERLAEYRQSNAELTALGIDRERAIDESRAQTAAVIAARNAVRDRLAVATEALAEIVDYPLPSRVNTDMQAIARDALARLQPQETGDA
jgi:chromosome segregation ATPase